MAGGGDCCCSKVTERQRPKDFAETVLTLACCFFSVSVQHDILGVIAA